MVGVDGGRAKGLEGIDRRINKFRFIRQTEGMVAAKAPLCKGSSAEGGEGLLQDKVEISMGTNANSCNFQFLCSTDHLPCPIEKRSCVVEGFWLLQIRISLHEDCKLSLRHSLSQLR